MDEIARHKGDFTNGKRAKQEEKKAVYQPYPSSLSCPYKKGERCNCLLSPSLWSLLLFTKRG
jgi:hypothetical protein